MTSSEDFNRQISLNNNHTQIQKFKSFVLKDKSVEITFGNGSIIKFEDCWLRDNCRCGECYNAETFQRSKHIVDIPDSNIKSFCLDDSKLRVTWDDKHESLYYPDFLYQFDYTRWINSRRLKPKLWAGESVKDMVAEVPMDEFLNTEGGAKKVFQSLLDYGIALITGAEPTLEGTEPVCKALGGIQNTFFGGMWEFSTTAFHADTAYTNLHLDLHHDSTYFTESTGLQILHCLEHVDGTGGETILVDGFYGATRLKEDHPEDFEFLTKFNVEEEFVEKEHNYRHSAPVIRIDTDTQDLVQIRYNVFDRTAMAFEDGEKCRAYYRSLRNLGRYFQDPRNQWQFKLKPGTVLAMDNFRVLHGRTAFTGKRTLGGTYVSRSDWLDRARTLGLIN
ncbi:trimethyllysine dioxygenase, mitochondrial [Ostrinia nubilalis]|uniref:trimethyllysine dioxygenase, mitochondrial n=1 Tax=Ostrinia nubilalis TaxID=29057 RepID=UPI00308230D4